MPLINYLLLNLERKNRPTIKAIIQNKSRKNKYFRFVISNYWRNYFNC